jgi:hypothetical protein
VAAAEITSTTHCNSSIAAGVHISRHVHSDAYAMLLVPIVFELLHADLVCAGGFAWQL